MTHEQEKAKELIIKFQFGFNLKFEDAKAYALITAKEVIKELKELPRISYNQRRTFYWEEVVVQINNH